MKKNKDCAATRADLLTDGGYPPRWILAAIAGIFISLIHVGIAVVNIDHAPHYDEIYHMLAAESWHNTGELRILDGEYTRASGFTKIVALQSYVCGPSLECARSFSIFASALIVFSVTIFAAVMMRPASGVVAGMLMALNPAVIHTSQLVRFYSLHALSFLLFAFLFYILITRFRDLPVKVSLLLTGIGIILLLGANHLQVLTQVGLLGIAMATVMINAPRVVGWFLRQSGFIIILSIITTAVIVFSGIYIVDIHEKIKVLRWTPVWAEGLENAYLFYYRSMRGWYPVLLPLTGFFALLSIVRWTRLTLYCLFTFVVCFAVISVAGVKGDRFLIFALPFLFIPLGAGMVMALEIVVDIVTDNLKRVHFFDWGKNRIHLLATTAVILMSLVYVISQPLILSAVRMVLISDNQETHFDRYYADWPAAIEVIQQLVEEYPTVITSSGVKAAWYLGSFDFDLNYSVMKETDTSDEFGIDPRTGRPVISSPESVRQVLQENAPALIIIEDYHANDRRAVSVEVMKLLDQVGDRVETDAKYLKIWVVSHKMRK